ncbi:creatininase family protein [Alicyclobacillus fastidiosus]|uniref:Creatininase family protein n=1 Tax=Alicyclobacillus fastidiosus TaxID=392011 RepID=A0ABV5AHP9_9BACL|nr:creatininase family protein [Alicyclobacillus fastidiosus]WEH11524.1 creatininase family protein [Alicyclobacillus fastidiosus]
MGTRTEDVRLAYKTWKQVQEYLNYDQTVIIPVGANEQHGPSCPVVTDTLLAEHLALEVGRRQGVLVGPTLPIGDSLIHLGFPGTIAFRPSTLMSVIKDYVTSLHKAGFRRFFVVNGHGDNKPPLQSAFSELGEELSEIRYFVHDFWDFPNFREILNDEFGDPNGGHADACDASLLMAIDPSLVNESLLTSEFPKVRYWISRDLVDDLYTKSGVIGSDQRLASKEVGKKLLEEAIQCYSQLLMELMEVKEPALS